jgi:2-methylcitrate dehydratase PrpD
MGRAEGLPSDVLEATKRHTLDTLTAILLGGELAAGRAARDLVDAVGARPGRSRTFLGTEVDAETAALVNGMAAHADETDDTHAPSTTHPGCAVVPAALAACEEAGADGSRFAHAVVGGYDVCARMSLALGPASLNSSRGGLSTHAIGGIFGATAAAGVGLDLGRSEIAHSMAYAAQLAGGTSTWFRDVEHIEKAFVFGGKPASQGYLAAKLALVGWPGVREVFDGEPNPLNALSQAPEAHELVAELGERFEICRTDIKRYPVGSPAQAPVEAILTLLDRRLPAEAVGRIEVRLPARMAHIADDRGMPNVNIQHLIGVVLVKGELSYEDALDHQLMESQAIKDVRERVRIVADDEMEFRRQAHVRALDQSGAPIDEEHVDAVLGTAARPIDLEAVAAKTMELLGPRTDGSVVDGLIDACRRLDDLGDCSALLPALTP